ncbi:MAG: cohesin domain-containing protein, partial [Bacteroidota bacterium]
MKIFYQLLLSGLFVGLASVLTAQPLTVTVADANGAVGTEVCVDVMGQNFVSISGMQFTIAYDPAVLTFVSASGNVNGTNVSMIQPASRPGQIRVSWSLFSTTGYTDAGPFNIGQVCFTVEQATETLVQITDDPIPTEFTTDANEIIDDVMINNGTINEGLGNTPNCMDGIQNGNETGVDCGGDCDPCPTCDDGVRNGNETGVDCGGDCPACPATCDDGVQNGNETGVDCGGDCDPCPTCNDGVQNGNETGVDCGGSCPACPATCDDGVQNGNETGVDCGGDCDPCPTCNDGVQNGNETGVDCGGSCVPCSTGGGPDTGCGDGTTALSLCLGDACDIAMGEPFCLDITAGNFNTVSGFQTDVTFPAGQLFYQSSTTIPALQDPIQISVVNAGTIRLLYFQQAQDGVSVADGTIIGTLCFTNQTTATTLLEVEDLVATGPGGQFPNPVGNGGSVNDCTSNPPTCNDGIQNGNETGVDCGGDCAPCNDTGGPDLNCG